MAGLIFKCFCGAAFATQTELDLHQWRLGDVPRVTNQPSNSDTSEFGSEMYEDRFGPSYDDEVEDEWDDD